VFEAKHAQVVGDAQDARELSGFQIQSLNGFFDIKPP
jgi:hypothetical protein